MKEAEMRQIGEMIAAVIREPESDEVKKRVRTEVAEITARFPMYPNRLKEKQNEAISGKYKKQLRPGLVTHYFIVGKILFQSVTGLLGIVFKGLLFECTCPDVGVKRVVEQRNDRRDREQGKRFVRDRTDLGHFGLPNDLGDLAGRENVRKDDRTSLSSLL